MLRGAKKEKKVVRTKLSAQSQVHEVEMNLKLCSYGRKEATQ